MRANVELAGRMTLGDRTWAHLTQTRIARDIAQAFDEVDLIVAPTSPVTPFAWTQLYATEVDGQPMENYYHWLALTYLPTLATNPSLSLPCGVDEAGMPFGLQLIGPAAQRRLAVVCCAGAGAGLVRPARSVSTPPGCGRPGGPSAGAAASAAQHRDPPAGSWLRQHRRVCHGGVAKALCAKGRRPPDREAESRLARTAIGRIDKATGR